MKEFRDTKQIKKLEESHFWRPINDALRCKGEEGLKKDEKYG